MLPVFGKVHRGFREALNKIWSDIEPFIIEANKKGKEIYFTGHSLGAAKATLAAARCTRLENTPNPNALFTYGSPKVGNKKYISFLNELSINHHRWVNNVDIVTRVPFPFYKHHGELHYMNHNGLIKKMSAIQMLVDRIKGAWTGLKNGKINYFINHGCEKYINNIEKNIEP